MSLEDRLSRIEERLEGLNGEISYIRGKVDSEANLLRWVVFPLLVIVAGLVGLKLALP